VSLSPVEVQIQLLVQDDVSGFKHGSVELNTPYMSEDDDNGSFIEIEHNRALSDVVFSMVIANTSPLPKWLGRRLGTMQAFPFRGSSSQERTRWVYA
jgi:hypothetical protein